MVALEGVLNDFCFEKMFVSGEWCLILYVLYRG